MLTHHLTFAGLAKRLTRAAGHPLSILAAVGVVLAWLALGPGMRFSDTWQLLISTTSSAVTLLMVFLIQNTQNRDLAAVQIKLDELIRVSPGAHNALLDLEELEEREVRAIYANYERLATAARAALRRGGSDTATPEVPSSPGRGA